MTLIPKPKALALLQQKIDAIPALGNRGHSSEEFTRWQNGTESLIEHLFGPHSKQWAQFAGIQFWAQFAIVEPESYSASTDRRIFLEGLRTARATLQSMIDEIQTFWPDDTSPASATPTPPLDSRKVFLVHGRDTAARDAVASYLRQLGLEPVILAERPNGGRTIIEKFEQESNVGYAIVLFTPDDIGGLQNADDQQARARQNVIFELGYFAGRLGRDRVCILTVPGVEIPSDIFGLGYVPFDSSGDGWKIGLGRELKNAGFNIDGNKVLS